MDLEKVKGEFRNRWDLCLHSTKRFVLQLATVTINTVRACVRACGRVCASAPDDQNILYCTHKTKENQKIHDNKQ